MAMIRATLTLTLTSAAGSPKRVFTVDMLEAAPPGEVATTRVEVPADMVRPESRLSKRDDLRSAGCHQKLEAGRAIVPVAAQDARRQLSFPPGS
eukprot:7901709-Pyramimonas_sp.AAC.1